MATSGQTLNDRINAARYALAGQGLARCVCKATTEEVIGPKKKHLDYLLACTHEPNVSIPQLANLLIERTNHIYWVVVFKALVTVHHLMSYGNERFIQYLASSNYSFELSSFLDKTSARDFSMSTFIRRYSRYINEKALSYRLLAFDFCKVKRGSDGVLRTMPIDRLLKTLPILQNQLDALLEFDCTTNDLNNGVINACFMLLFRDLIGLFACHNDGIINLLNKYFTLNKKMCREAFEHYKKFLIRMDKVSEFLRVAEAVGMDKDEIPDLRRAPSSLIDALEQHLQNIESNKKVFKQQSSSTASTISSNKSAEFSMLGNLTPPPSSLSQNASNPSAATNINSALDDFPLSSFKDDEVRKALEEEARVLSQYGTDGLPKVKYPKVNNGNNNSIASGDNSPKFAVTETIPKTIDDIFGDSNSFAISNNGFGSASSGNGINSFDNTNRIPNISGTGKSTRPDMDSIKSTIQSATTTLEKVARSGPKKASDELFSLLDSTTVPGPQPSGASSSMSPFESSASPFDIAMTTSSSGPQAALKSNGNPPTLKPGNPFPDLGNDFSSKTTSAFSLGFSTKPAANTQTTNSIFKTPTTGVNYTNLGELDGFGDLPLQPMTSTQSTTKGATSSNNFATSKSAFNSNSGLSSTGLFKGDLDSTLANLAQNLTFEGISKPKK